MCEHDNCGHDHEHHEEKGFRDYLILGTRIVVSAILAFLGAFVFKEETYGLAVNLPLMLVAYALISYDIYMEAFAGIFHEHRFFDETTLMIVASLGAFSLRAFGLDHNEFLEAVLVILLFQVGEVLEDLAADKSKEAILGAIDCKQEHAKILVGEEIKTKESEDLVPGDIVLVGNGEKILCDGIVIAGKAEVDESSLSGEARPIAKETGVEVYSGTILVSGFLKVSVNKAYEDSTVAKFVSMVENAYEEKSRSERFITKFAKIYTPLVVILAIFIAILPPLFIGVSDGSVWARWVYVSLSFLVISCPCAIVISVPLAYFSGLGLASKNGILVKGASYFDALNDLKTVAFDKTGTMTEGRLEIAGVYPCNGNEDEYMEYLRIAESNSLHPLAKAVMGETTSQNYSFESYEEETGKGIKAVFQGRTIVAGRASYLEELGILATKDDIALPSIHLGVDGVYWGYVCFDDNIKKGSNSFVVSMKRRGICTVLLSGDQDKVVSAVAKTLGVDEYRSSLLPEEKLQSIKSLKQEKGGTIAYLGDGINDAPTLVASDVGVAMGALGSDLAVANADAVILNDDPMRFVLLTKIAEATRRRAIFNIVFSLTLKAAILILGVIASSMGTWQLPLWVSVIGDTGVAVMAILFSLLLQLKKFRVE